MPDLSRFVAAQDRVWTNVIAELAAGRKRTHWMWFVFPQIEGLGHSAMAERYAIASLDEALAYLAHPVLGPRLADCVDLLLAVEGRSANEVMGSPDDFKLRSSMTLFARAAGDPAPFRAVLDKWYGGAEDPLTLERI
ncbi:MAG: DUF1810 domain-containing protein [Notoacmeibacter sp.]|nr:DUF1810 domain-containing protein [Notoacmeibacter sp.]